MRSVQRVFRMAYAATVTLHDATGKALHPAIWPDAAGDIDGLCTALSDDVLALLSRCPKPACSRFCATEPGSYGIGWARNLTESSMGRPVHRLVDLWHLLEKLGSAAKVLYGDEEASAQLGKWRLSLLNEDNAVEQIHKTLVDSQRSPCASATVAPMHEAITYLENHREDMRYATARRLGLPVGSGNT